MVKQTTHQYQKLQISIASLSKDAYNRTIVINGVSKAYAMIGWQIEYVASNKNIIKLMTRIQSHTTSNANSIAQMVAKFKNRRNYMLSKLENIKIFKLY